MMNYEDVLRRMVLFEAINYLPNDYSYSTAPAGYTGEKEKFKRATRNEWSPYPGTTCGFLCVLDQWNRDGLWVDERMTCRWETREA